MSREIRHNRCRRDTAFVPMITFQFMAENSPLALSAPSRKSPFGIPEPGLQYTLRTAELTSMRTTNSLGLRPGIISIFPRPQHSALSGARMFLFLDSFGKFSQCAETGNRCRTFACSNSNINNEIVTCIVDLSHGGAQRSQG